MLMEPSNLASEEPTEGVKVNRKQKPPLTRHPPGYNPTALFPPKHQHSDSLGAVLVCIAFLLTFIAACLIALWVLLLR